MSTRIYGSLARIADFHDSNFELHKLPRSEWATGDYVECEVTGARTDLYHIEGTDGAMIPVNAGDRVVGALGDREATLEGVGSWRAVQEDRMDALTNAGLFGAFTSLSTLLARPISLRYLNHCARNGEKVTMKDFALEHEGGKFEVPTLLLVGTSMSAGKTTTGKLACQVLTEAGVDVIGAKLTGAGRYRDILAFKAAGAREIFDFVDVGLPSTVAPEDEFRAAIEPLLHHIDHLNPDVLVTEAGASPLEPYNGAAAIDELGDNVRCCILCASDPYAVVGVEKAFGLVPDLVTGPATNTSAAIALVRKLTGVEGINVLGADAPERLSRFLKSKFGL